MEVIGVIQTITGVNFKAARNHWYYLRQKKLLPELKNHGALQTAQGKTTERSSVTTEKLMRWYGTADAALRELDRLNSWHPKWENTQNSNKVDFFWGNTDETNMSALEVKF